MAITVVGASAVMATNGGAPTAITPTGSTATGDFLIWYHYSRATGGNETVTPPSGFTSIFNSLTANNGLVAAAYRFRQAGDSTYTASVTNHTSGTSGETILEWIETFRGVDTTTPVGSVTAALSTWASSLNIGSIAAPASPSLAARNMVIVFGGRFENVTGQTALTGDSLTWNLRITADSTLGSDAGAVTQMGLNQTGSSQTITAKTITTTGTAQAGAGIMFIVNAAPPATPPDPTGDVVYVDSTTTGAAAFQPSRSPAIPSGATTDDVIVVRMSRWESVNPAVTKPTGWIQLAQEAIGNLKLDTFVFRCDDNTSGTATFSWSGNMWTVAHAILYRGVDRDLDLSTLSLVDAQAANTTTFPSVTANSVPEGAALDWHAAYGTALTVTAPSGFTEVEENDQDSSSYQESVAAGNYTISGGVVTGGSPSTDLIASVLVLPAEPAAGGTTTIGKELALVWDTRAAAFDELSAIWDVRAAVSDDLVSIWDIRALVNDQVQLLWDVRASLGDSLSLLWDVQGPIAKDLSLLWDIRSAIGDELALIWDVRVPVGDPLALVWDVRAALGDELSLLWDIIGPAAKELSLSWDVRAAVSDSLQALWDTRAAVGDDIVVIWDTRAPIGDVLALVWDVRSVIGAPVVLVWDVRVVLGDSITLVWDVRSPAGDDLVLLWDTQSTALLATKDLSLVWDTRAPLGDTLTLNWDLRGILGDSLAVAWDIRAALSSAVGLLWDVRSVVGDSLSAVWDVRSIIGDGLTLAWHIKMGTGKDITLVWDIQSDIPTFFYVLTGEVLERWRLGVIDVNGTSRRWATSVVERFRTEVRDEGA